MAMTKEEREAWITPRKVKNQRGLDAALKVLNKANQTRVNFDLDVEDFIKVKQKAASERKTLAMVYREMVKKYIS